MPLRHCLLCAYALPRKVRCADRDPAGALLPVQLGMKSARVVSVMTLAHEEWGVMALSLPGEDGADLLACHRGIFVTERTINL